MLLRFEADSDGALMEGARPDAQKPQAALGLEFDLLRDAERIVNLDPEISDCTLQLGVREQQLHSS